MSYRPPLLPTNTAKHIARITGLNEIMAEGVPESFYEDFNGMLRDFQKVALVSSFETARRCFLIYLKEDEEVYPRHEAAMKMIYDVTKDEAKGIVLNRLMEIANSDDLKTATEATRVLQAMLDGKGPSTEEAAKILVTLTRAAK